MNEYIDALLANYDDSPGLCDFKEELISNLNARVAKLIQGGMSEDAAMQKALSELGDVTSVADEISLKKRQGSISKMYMPVRKYLTRHREVSYVASLTLFVFVLICTVVAWINARFATAQFVTLMVFSVPAIMGLVWLTLTQETAIHEPMSSKRAICYATIVGLFVFGLMVSDVILFSSIGNYSSAIGAFIIFALPAFVIGLFLILTEKNRRKSRVIVKDDKLEKDTMLFRLYSGALWISAISLLVAFWIFLEMKFAWLSILIALVIQLIIQARFMKSK
jgi:hypothetical protein